jgi:hypothetical protein
MKIEASVLKPETHWKNIGGIPVGKSYAADKSFFNDSFYPRFILDFSIFSSHFSRLYGKRNAVWLITFL